MTRKTSTLAARVNAAAGKKPTPMIDEQAGRRKRAPNGIRSPGKQGTGGVLVSAIYPPEVRKALKMMEAESGQNLRQLLGRAINLLAVEMKQPQPFREDA